MRIETIAAGGRARGESVFLRTETRCHWTYLLPRCFLAIGCSLALILWLIFGEQQLGKNTYLRSRGEYGTSSIFPCSPRSQSCRVFTECATQKNPQPGSAAGTCSKAPSSEPERPWPDVSGPQSAKPKPAM